jgi:hypothetical protein
LLEQTPTLVVVITDQVSRTFAKWRCFSHLLGCPFVCRISGDAKVDHAAGAQLDNDEHEHCAKEDIVGLKKVAGPNLAGVVAQERGPVLARRISPSHLLNVLLNWALSIGEATG